MDVPVSRPSSLQQWISAKSFILRGPASHPPGVPNYHVGLAGMLTVAAIPTTPHRLDGRLSPPLRPSTAQRLSVRPSAIEVTAVVSLLDHAMSMLGQELTPFLRSYQAVPEHTRSRKALTDGLKQMKSLICRLEVLIEAMDSACDPKSEYSYRTDVGGFKIPAWLVAEVAEGIDS